jgi:hypothetical protein
MRKESVVLEHESDATLFGWAVDSFVQPDVVSQSDTPSSTREARDDVERRRLARA